MRVVIELSPQARTVITFHIRKSTYKSLNPTPNQLHEFFDTYHKFKIHFLSDPTENSLRRLCGYCQNLHYSCSVEAVCEGSHTAKALSEVENCWPTKSNWPVSVVVIFLYRKNSGAQTALRSRHIL